MSIADGGAVDVVHASCPAEWRAWLEQRSASRPQAWLVIPHARSGRAGVSHRQAIEEALCFGWIDGLARRHDATSWRQRFSPRSPRSAWSSINRELVAELTREGRMAPAGLAAVATAQRTGMWELLADAQAGIVPPELRAALDEVPGAARGWLAWSPSARRAALESLARAKRPDTRTRRIAAVVTAAAAAPVGGAPSPR
ncbi:YdeI/OmpD-associated family protein [Pseudonocardia humida]|uniref:YdeI/OmpD-associated family protein n=1 Tax=Pseudonocardia humida TaxID=2800819 RepID=A0ABT0ZWB7_9PSEU|nr:YdeI/OmpD-associated family protein [Pseudonocardia humida]MCO1655044.1 YdeI/OmpD-associated family protein [Pseudonocardia humida]